MEVPDDLKLAFQELKAYYDELNGESARAAVILMVAALEDELEKVILTKFPRSLSRQVWKEICGPGHKPLGSFKAKIDMARAFGFIGKETHKSLKHVSTVRNKFAHGSRPRSFLDDDVLKICSKLDPSVPPDLHGQSKPSENDVRSSYTDKVRSIHEGLERLSQYREELDGGLMPVLP